MNTSPKPPARSAAMTVLWSTVAWALLTGLLEAGIHAYRRYGLHELINRSRDVYWLVPIGYLVLFALPGIVLVLLARRWPRRWNPGVAAFPLVTASALSLMAVLVWNRIHPLAMALLAVGIGYQTARLTQRHPEGYARLVRRGAVFMGIVVLALATGIVGKRIWTERQAVAALPDAPSASPNVLLIILDTVRAAQLSLYGYERETTPNLSVRARSGVVFDRAISTAPWTLPSHASIFTGLYPDNLSTGWGEPLDDTERTIAEAFRNQGYVTGGFVANLIYATSEEGLARGFIHYEEHPLNWGTMLADVTLSRRVLDAWSLRPFVGTDAAVNEKPAPVIAGDFLAWQERHQDRPFFAFLNFLDAHDPYLPPEPWFEKFAGYRREHQLSPFRRYGSERRDSITVAEVEEEIAAYDGAIGYMDHILEEIFRELEQRGELDNTIVIVTADHGEELGEHDLYLHGHSLYIQTLHVPLVIFGPGVPEGIRITASVSLRDLASTIQDLAGLPDSPGFPGESLRSVWENGPAAASPALSTVQKGIRISSWYPAAAGDMASLLDGSLHFIRNADTLPELYDVATDPEELSPLSADTARKSSLARRLRDLLSGPREVVSGKQGQP